MGASHSPGLDLKSSGRLCIDISALMHFATKLSNAELSRWRRAKAQALGHIEGNPGLCQRISREEEEVL